ncbi:MAG TPA: hypothetical protein VN668_12670 [Stellaceae bacterium]|nr:hypothetical protein [Stellaceae bacterium]
MNEQKKPSPRLTPAGEVAARWRQEKLAAALRANLGRRKAQARERTEPASPGEKPAEQD